MMSKTIILSFLVLVVAGYVSSDSEPYFIDETNPDEAELIKRQAASPAGVVKPQGRGFDMASIAALASSPMAKMAMTKGMELMKSPMVQGILKSDKLKEMMKPETLKKLMNSEAAQNLMKPESLKAVMDSPLAKKIMDNPKVKSMMESDALKGYLDKAKEMMPAAMELAKGALAKYTNSTTNSTA